MNFNCSVSRSFHRRTHRGSVVAYGSQDGEKKRKPLSARWNLLFLPAVLLILLVFTNDVHEQVFSFAEGLQNATKYISLSK